MDILSLDDLKQADYGSYLIVRQLPDTQNALALEWESFVRSLDAILFQVTEPGLRDIRYQWWLETYQRAKDGHFSGHPFDGVLKRLTQAQSSQIDEKFEAFVGSYHTLSHYNAFHMFDVWQNWLDDHHALRLCLGCASLGTPIDLPAQTLSSYGLLAGIAHLLEHLPFYAGAGYELLPRDLLELHGVHAEFILAGSKGEGGGWNKLLCDFQARCHQAETILKTTPIQGAYASYKCAHALGTKSILRKAMGDRDTLLKPIQRSPLQTYLWLHWHKSRLVS